MNILMMTNTYKPFVGGVPRSVEIFSEEYEKNGHRVMIVAPEYENTPSNETNVVRIPAIQNFNGTDFSMPLPVPGILTEKLESFDPDIVHSHHPYLIGDTALRIAARYSIPLVFTYHTLYEKYTHYIPADSPAFKRFVKSLSVGYANLCDCVFAPSDSLADLIRERGVETPIRILPTGVDVTFFGEGSGHRFRESHNIGENAFVIGFVSRLAPEKNIGFLSRAVASAMKRNGNMHFLLVGEGQSKSDVVDLFTKNGIAGRLHCTGALNGRDLVDAYHAMDVFAFASKSETQGMVVTESMAAGVPVVAIDASGVREVVRNEYNGRLLDTENESDFSAALEWYMSLEEEELRRLKQNAVETAASFSREQCAKKALDIYEKLIAENNINVKKDTSPWEETKSLLKAEWDILTNIAGAAENLILPKDR